MHSKSQQMTLWYGYFGLLPFFTLAILLAFRVLRPDILRVAFDTYSAILLAFMAGIYWPLAMQGQGAASPMRLMRASVLLTLWGWFALLLPDIFRALAFLAGFGVLFGIDRYVLEDLWSSGYLVMRGHLTIGVIASQLLVAIMG